MDRASPGDHFSINPPQGANAFIITDGLESARLYPFRYTLSARAASKYTATANSAAQLTDLGAVVAVMGLAWPLDLARWDSVAETVRRWRGLAPSWFECARGLPTDVFDAALRFIQSARASQVPAPADIAVDDDGEIAFRWKDGRRLASACFLPDGDIIAYVSLPDQNGPFKWEAPLSQQTDFSDLFQNLRHFLVG